MKLQTDDGGVVEVLPLRGTIRLAVRDAAGTVAAEVTLTDKEAAVIEAMLAQAHEF